MKEYTEVRQRIIRAVTETVSESKASVEDMAERIANEVMDAIEDNYRSITEVHDIVNAVRTGAKIQIAYADPDEDDLLEDTYAVKACW